MYKKGDICILSCNCLVLLLEVDQGDNANYASCKILNMCYKCARIRKSWRWKPFFNMLISFDEVKEKVDGEVIRLLYCEG